ncbi:MAG: hypothetical protein ABIH11_02415 [Candidatus Altiarchaeota archaeon]
MRFQQQKSKALNDYRASVRVGDVDESLIPLLDEINRMESYYTTSSCGGRIALLEELGGKGLNRFIRKWHDKASVEDVMKAMGECSTELWFKCEPPILHVVAKSLEDANHFLHEAREAGFKRSGLQSSGEDRNVLEVLSTESINTPLVVDGKIVVAEEYVRILVEDGNRKLESGWVKIERLRERLSRGPG